MIQRLLESLATQDLSNVAVSIYNDGEDNVISNTLLQKYPFVSSYTVCEHMGTSKLRNKMIAETNSDYF